MVRYTEHEPLYNSLVDIFQQIEMITYTIIAHDGTLFSTRARDKGCLVFPDRVKKLEPLM